MPSITVGFNVGPAVLQAARGLFSVESSPSSFSKTGALGFTIAVTPANPTIVSGTEQFTATATYTDNSTQNVTTTATWTSSNTAVATISNTSGTQGLATEVSSGYTTITATLTGVSGSTTLSIGSVLTGVKFNPGWYLQTDSHNYATSEIDILATTGTGGAWTGSKFLGYCPDYDWGYLEPTAGSYNFAAVVTDFNYLQSKCPGARMIVQLQWGYSSGAGVTLDPTNAPVIPSDILSNAAFGAGPTGLSGTYGWGLSGWNNVSGAGARWQIPAAAMWRPAVANRWFNFLQQFANFSFVTTSGPYSGQTFTFNTHPLIEGIFDWMEDSWNFWYGPATQGDYSDSAFLTFFQNEMANAVTYWTQTAFATYQSYGWSNAGTFPNPDLPPLILYASNNRNALSNSDTFGNGISAVSAHEIYCGFTWNGSSWVSGSTNPDLRGKMAYMASVQGYDYNNETPGGSGNQAAAILAIYATMQTLHATHGCWNIWDENFAGNSPSPASFVSTYLVPFVNSHAIPNTTAPTNYPPQTVTTVTWNNPTQNTDGSAISGITGYLIGVRPTSTSYTSGPVSPYPYTVQVAAGTTSVLLSAFTPAIPHGTYVSAAQAIAGGVYSAWSVESAPFII